MARVFISHASADLAVAVELHRWLDQDGHEVFLDQDLRDGIAVGEQWEQRLHERLRWANAVVCVVTSAYLASEWCTAEVSIARSRGNRLLPVRAEPGVEHALLTEIQHTDLTLDRVAAQTALAEALRRVDTAGDSSWPDELSPFPGLIAFDVDRHRVFFGRTRDIEQLAGLLRSAAKRAEGAALLVVGPSGCGKSSLVRAGLLPVMGGEPGWWALPPMVPGADPVAALVRGLTTSAQQIGLGWTADRVRHQLAKGDLAGLAEELLRAAPGGSLRRLLVVVDQLEELLTHSAPAQRARFAEVLRPALTGPVQMVGTLRSEFLDQMLGDPELAALPTNTYPLRPLRREALRAVIEEPARMAGIGVDEPLVARLVEDTDSGEALPLLAFTLAQLAEGIRRGGQLSAMRYEQLGGVQGALRREADAALAEAVAAGGRNRQEVITELLRLVTVDEQGRPTRWRMPRCELSGPVAAELDTYVARRLLSTDTDNGNVVISVAHDAFLTAWPPLAEAITRSASALRARRAVERAAAEWHQNHRPPARLWGGGQLAAAVTDTGARVAPADAPPVAGWLPRRGRRLVTDRVELSSAAREFLQASIRRDRYRRRRAVTVLSVLLILALVAAGIAITQQRLAQERQRIAIARQLVAQAETALEPDPRTALKLGIAAERIHSDGETRASLVNALTTSPYAGTLTGHSEPVRAVAFAPDGHTLATGSNDNTVLLWDLSDRTHPSRIGPSLTGYTSSVSAAAFSPDGKTLATGSEDEGAVLWDLTNRAHPHRMGPLVTEFTTSVFAVSFSPDGKTLATGGMENMVTLWDLTDPARPRPLAPPLGDPTGPVFAVAYAPDRDILATGSSAGAVTLWDLSDPARPRPFGPPLTGHTGAVDATAFSQDGKTLAIGGVDRTVSLWEVSNPAQPRQLAAPLTGSSGSLVFAPDGTTLAAAGGAAAAVILWDLTDRAHPRRLEPPLTGHRNDASAIAFSPDGRTLATGGVDGTVILWDLTGQGRPRRLGPPEIDNAGTAFAIASSPDGRVLAVGSLDGPVLLWDLADPARPRRLGPPLTGLTATVFGVAFSPDGNTLAAGAVDGTVIRWDLTNRVRPHRLEPPLVGAGSGIASLAYAPDGGALAAGSHDGTVTLWDLRDRARPRRLEPPLVGPRDRLAAVAFSQHGTLATGGLGETMQWDLTDPARPSRIEPPLGGHTNPVHSLAYAPDGNMLATGSDDGTVILWDLTNRAQPRRLGQPLTGHTGILSTSVTAVAYAPGGNTLATGSSDDTVVLWDLTDRNRPRRLGQPLPGHHSVVASLAYASGGNTLVAGHNDGSVTRWDLTGLNSLRAHAVERACALTGAGLDQDEWDRYVSGLPYQDTCAAS
ncbi:MAG TPA: TIR domain-containing protein [Pseudonocardiaceae bacterium]|nr:TIR domain-containing protein [Pseudonocardiaceae bacterium]